MNRDVLTAILGIVASALTGIGGIVALLFRSIIAYLFARIKTLEDREATILKSLVETAASQQGTMEDIGAFVTDLADDRKYRERRSREEKGATP
jgi:uncharacterized membrane protein